MQVEFVYNSLHHYHSNGNNFFEDAAYLGGNRDYKFVKVPIGFGHGIHWTKNNLPSSE